MADATEQTINLVLGENNSAILTPQWFITGKYAPVAAGYAPLINGERAFATIAKAIEQAQKSIDIITWGFQASMYFTRGSKGQAKRVGDLLEEAAGRGVKVRILVWYTLGGNKADPNFPGWQAAPRDFGYANMIAHASDGYRASGSQLPYQTPEDYEYDCQWHWEITIKKRGNGNIIIKHRELNWTNDAQEATERQTSHHVKEYGDIDYIQGRLLALYPTHHQKVILVDYEDPDDAVGFVMGHNSLSTYWDKDSHSETQLPAYLGRDGNTAWQDNSSCVCGAILAHINHNFVEAWEKNVGNDAELSQRMSLTESDHKFTEHRMEKINNRLINAVTVDGMIPLKKVMAQICRTQPQYNEFDVLRLYKHTLVRARKYIYIENQYFRYPPFVALLQDAINERVKEGYDIEQNPLYLFVVTNSSSDAAIHAGSYQTYKMLEALQRPDMVPNYHRKEHKLGEDDAVVAGAIPGIKSHICTLISPDSTTPWRSVYVHSKVMMIDDTFMTLGSSNVNLRSMLFDSEFNIAIQDTDMTNIIPPIRQHLWNMHTKQAGDNFDKEFKNWSDIIDENKRLQDSDIPTTPVASLIEFFDGNKTWKNMD
ncbi:phospholipase D-like domain-containing protein [Providencia burhodogranariea]|uniref:Phospholipase D/transphosphatidylase n=1 Tax=Providencia burhodogranariea DSM 19968 TaxID=1141662 RepID=K8WBU2_9GAMM|nr:phospholipase D-like domain-containing protein [Providencia burhodogranariea]EKT58118.1 phospholipase D/transphosphatidylase [Providencia burhodogranariea DSM 19968]